jgi:S-sulfo-L-cysteine synthase (O-acetyl-L-serine-dependent)
MSLVPVWGEGFPPPEPQRVPSVLHLVGNTPLLELTKVTAGISSRVRVFAKLEGFNPGGSVKDRPALKMVAEGLRSGLLAPGKTILDSTSGNTGIALAMVGAVLGYPVELVIPANVSIERKKIIAAYGARMIFSSPLEGSDGAIRLCRQILHESPERYFKPDQYFNEANPQAHYETTGPEIWVQTQGKITHLVAGIGTGGTIMGTGRYLKERNPQVQVLAVEPDDAFHGLEGLKHMASSIVPGIYHEKELDGKIPVSTESAYDAVYRLGREEGVLVGQSSGAAIWAALKVARTLEEGVVVTLFPDFGDKYLSTNLWVGWKEFEKKHR